MFKSKLFLFIAAMVLAAPLFIFAGTASAANSSLTFENQAWEEAAFRVAGLDEMVSAAETENAAAGQLPRRRVLGTLTEVTPQNFTLDIRGNAVVFAYDELTRFRASESEASAADLQTGRWVGVVAKPGGGDDPLAVLVIILPEDFDPTLKAERHLGEVTAVDQTAQTLTIQARIGEVHTFLVNSDTIFKGDYASLADVAVGDKVAVAGRENADGSLVLKAITSAERAYLRPFRVVGTIASVDAANSTLTLTTPQADSLTIEITPETRFRSKDSTITGLDDLSSGMQVLVFARPQEDGSLVALALGARQP